MTARSPISDQSDLPPGILVYKVEDQLSIPSLIGLKRGLLSSHTQPRVLILSLSGVFSVSIIDVIVIEDALGALESVGVQVVLCELKSKIRFAL